MGLCPGASSARRPSLCPRTDGHVLDEARGRASGRTGDAQRSGRPGTTTRGLRGPRQQEGATVDLVSVHAIPLNVILALDMSQSVSGERLVHLQNASRTLLGGLKSEDRAA